jgi:hypothetical protein
MAQGFTGPNIQVNRKDLSGLVRACHESNLAIETWLREGLLEAAEWVRKDAAASYAAKSLPGAMGLKAKVTRPGNAIVAQTLRKSRGSRRRGNFGSLEMRTSLLPALQSNQPRADAQVAGLLNRLGAFWEAP